MLGLILIYFIWTQYSELAFEHDKSKWKYSLLGIATYYIGTFVAGIAIGLCDYFAGTQIIEKTNSILLSFIALPFGLLFVWGLYKFLENRWENNKNLDSDSLDHNLLESNTEDY